MPMRPLRLPAACVHATQARSDHAPLEERWLWLTFGSVVWSMRRPIAFSEHEAM
jgi:hypothetical protein